MKKSKVQKLIQLGSSRVFNDYKELIIALFRIRSARDYVEKYFIQNCIIKRNEGFLKGKNYFFVNATLVSLKNYYLLSLWKFFDQKSDMNVYDIRKVSKDLSFNNFFDSRVGKIKKELNWLKAWRGGVAAHHNLEVWVNSELFQKKYPLDPKSVKKIEEFLIGTWKCLIPVAVATKILKEIEDDLQKEAKSILK